MKQYIKAEWELYKRNTVNVILALCGVVLFAILLMFSGIGGAQYSAIISIVGYVTFLLLIIGFYLSPASYWKNKQKVGITTEQLLLTLGESKRIFVKIRMCVFFVLYFGMVLLIALMQIPAYFIGGEQYSLWYFAIEVVTFTAFVFLSTPILYVVPYRWLPFAFPGWSGFCGGLAGGLLGDTEEFVSYEEVFGTFAVVAIVGVVVGFLCILYRYVKTIREERRTVRRAR